MSYKYKFILTRQVFSTASILNFNQFSSPIIVSMSFCCFLATVIFVSANPKTSLTFPSSARFQQVAKEKLNSAKMHWKLLKIFHQVLNYWSEVIKRFVEDEQNIIELIII